MKPDRFHEKLRDEALVSTFHQRTGWEEDIAAYTDLLRARWENGDYSTEELEALVYLEMGKFGGLVFEELEKAAVRRLFYGVLKGFPDTYRHDGWKAKLPPFWEVSAAEPLPLDALPSVLADAMSVVAHNRMVNPEIPYTAYMAVVSGALADRVRVWVGDSWSQPVNLYLVAVASSGDGKSPGFAPAGDLGVSLDAALARRVRPERDKALREMRQLHARIKTAQRDGNHVDADLAQNELEQVEVRARQRTYRMVDDFTPEALADHLDRSRGRAAIALSDEGLPIHHALGLYSRTPNLAVFLNAYDGSPVNINRKNPDAPEVRIPRALLSIGAAVQPHVLERASGDQRIDDRGLLARFLICWPETMRGHRTRDESQSLMPEDAVEALSKVVLDLDSRLSGQTDIKLSPEAQRRYWRWHNEVEKGNAYSESRARVTAKVRGAVPRLAALFHLLDGSDGEVSDEVVERAIRVGDHHIAQGLAIERQGDVSLARKVIERLLSAESAGRRLTIRDLYREMARTTDQRMAAVSVLDHLNSLDWLRMSNSRVPSESAVKGEEAPAIWLHPEAATVYREGR